MLEKFARKEREREGVGVGGDEARRVGWVVGDWSMDVLMVEIFIDLNAGWVMFMVIA